MHGGSSRHSRATLVSGGHRKRLIQCLTWCLPFQGSSGPLVELGGDMVEITLRNQPEVRSAGVILAQQSIGVLIAAALPGGMRVAEISRTQLHLIRHRHQPDVPDADAALEEWLEGSRLVLQARTALVRNPGEPAGEARLPHGPRPSPTKHERG